MFVCLVTQKTFQTSVLICLTLLFSIKVSVSLKPDPDSEEMKIMLRTTFRGHVYNDLRHQWKTRYSGTIHLIGQKYGVPNICVNMHMDLFFIMN